MKIAIHGRSLDERTIPFVQKTFDELSRQKIEVLISKDFNTILDQFPIKNQDYKTFDRGSDIFFADFIFSIGGDGTLLDSVTYAGAKQIPILGINTGRLGFLSTVSKDEISEAIKALLNNRYTLDRRALIHVDASENIFDGINFGLNEFSILKKDTSAMIKVDAFINEEFLNTYWADGLIVATPTGSTGYSLSCGGPIVMPESNNFVITPVSAHNLNVTPLIVSDSCEVSFKIEGRGNQCLASLDSRSCSVSTSIKIKVKKEHFKACLVKLGNHNFFDTLRKKLNWGLDVRN